MITVIIAGGSGTRLWPLSTPDYPKHLLKLNGDERSLLQNTYDRAKRISEKIYVITEKSHADHVKEQLSELPEEHFIVEPARRGTASCIVAALAHVSKREDENEAIAVLSADHFIRDNAGFAQSFKIAGEASEKEGRIVLVGVEPDYPATGFGYIKKDELFDEERFVYNVDSFKEKPPFETAKRYLKSGDYLWNCGYFVGSLATFKEKMKLRSPELLENYQKLLNAKSDDEYHETYLGFKNDTIDYGLIEHVQDLLVVPAAFDWMDLGSFNDLHKAVVSDEQSNYISGQKVELEGVDNAYVHNAEEKPVAVIGLDNIAVVNTKDGLLIARKDLAQKVGEVSKRINGKGK
ncbi:MAG: mannose-1-phosphate guanylyltransferase [Candidatus Saccharibacteria bacterium]|nr:mannose-1-phosphate guanylyltransferase [Candidatus Saccharibacteria bacterium]